MNIYCRPSQLPSATHDDRPGMDGLEIDLGDERILIYMDNADAEVYALAINRAKLQCLSRKLHQQGQSLVSSDAKL